jgi:opacity protein-like surface antigen
MSSHNVFLTRRQAKAGGRCSLRVVARIPLAVSGVALMAGLLAATGAQAQSSACTPASGTETMSQFFPFASGGAVNAFTSVMNTVNTAFLTNTSALVSAPGDVPPNTFGSGVWVRSIGGTVDTKTTGTFTGNISFTYNNIPNTASGTDNCHTKIHQDYAGFQIGHDIASLKDSVVGGNVHFGVTAGYVGANANQSGGALTSNFQVPFVGVYSAYSKGNLLVDAQLRADFYQTEINDPVTNGIFHQRLDARDVTLTANAAYRFDLRDRWFVEPSIGGVFSHVSVDQFDLSGNLIQGTGVALPGTVNIHDFDSELGRASVRVGTTVNLPEGRVVAQPYFTASVYHEFAGAVTSSMSTIPISGTIDGNSYNISPGSGTFTTSRVGTYAQFGVGSAFQWLNTGWLAYIRGDYRTGENIEGWGVNAGLRYQLGAETAGLKDGGSLKDAPAPVAYNWSGIYLGGSFGGTWGTESWHFASAGSGSEPDFAGLLAGGQIGYNYQIGRAVAGIEADFGGSNARGAAACPTADFFSCQASVDKLGSVAARLGYTSGRTLYYAKGGFAFGDITASGHDNTGGLIVPPVASTTQWGNGWTVGGGFEVMLADHWSAKAEYMHYDLGKQSYTVQSTVEPAEVATTGDTVRVGVNYHIQESGYQPLK